MILIGGLIGFFIIIISFRSIKNKLSKRDNIILIVLTVLSVINFPACIFNLLALTYNKEDKYLMVVNPEYREEEKKEKPILKSTPFILTTIALVGIIGFSVIGNRVETLNGTVTVTDHKLTKKETDEYNRNQPLNGTSYTIEYNTTANIFKIKPK